MVWYHPQLRIRWSNCTPPTPQSNPHPEISIFCFTFSATIHQPIISITSRRPDPRKNTSLAPWSDSLLLNSCPSPALLGQVVDIQRHLTSINKLVFPETCSPASLVWVCHFTRFNRNFISPHPPRLASPLHSISKYLAFQCLDPDTPRYASLPYHQTYHDSPRFSFLSKCGGGITTSPTLEWVTKQILKWATKHIQSPQWTIDTLKQSTRSSLYIAGTVDAVVSQRLFLTSLCLSTSLSLPSILTVSPANLSLQPRCSSHVRQRVDIFH